MENKKCSKCEETHPISKYRIIKARNNRKETISNICTFCVVISNKESRSRNPEEYNRKARVRRMERKERAIAYKGGMCAMCGGVFHPAAFDFHHIDPSKKEKDPGLMMSCSDSALFLELDKCILLCSNCHRELHYEEHST